MTDQEIEILKLRERERAEDAFLAQRKMERNLKLLERANENAGVRENWKSIVRGHRPGGERG